MEGGILIREIKMAPFPVPTTSTSVVAENGGHAPSPAHAHAHGWSARTADDMDEERARNVAYQYLCHLEEAKNW